MVFNGNLLFQGAPYFQVPCKLSGGISDPQSLPKFSGFGWRYDLDLKTHQKTEFLWGKRTFFRWLELVVIVEDCCCGGGGGSTKIDVGGRTQSDK